MVKNSIFLNSSIKILSLALVLFFMFSSSPSAWCMDKLQLSRDENTLVLIKDFGLSKTSGARTSSLETKAWAYTIINITLKRFIPSWTGSPWSSSDHRKISAATERKIFNQINIELQESGKMGLDIYEEIYDVRDEERQKIIAILKNKSNRKPVNLLEFLENSFQYKHPKTWTERIMIILIEMEIRFKRISKYLNQEKSTTNPDKIAPLKNELNSAMRELEMMKAAVLMITNKINEDPNPAVIRIAFKLADWMSTNRPEHFIPGDNRRSANVQLDHEHEGLLDELFLTPSIKSLLSKNKNTSVDWKTLLEQSVNNDELRQSISDEFFVIGIIFEGLIRNLEWYLVDLSPSERKIFLERSEEIRASNPDVIPPKMKPGEMRIPYSEDLDINELSTYFQMQLQEYAKSNDDWISHIEKAWKGYLEIHSLMYGRASSEEPLGAWFEKAATSPELYRNALGFIRTLEDWNHPVRGGAQFAGKMFFIRDDRTRFYALGKSIAGEFSSPNQKEILTKKWIALGRKFFPSGSRLALWSKDNLNTISKDSFDHLTDFSLHRHIPLPFNIKSRIVAHSSISV